jgi:Protein of unknown function (DUF4003)
MDPTATYLETFEKLRKRKRWTTNTTILRFVALTLASLDLGDPHTALEHAAADLRKRAGWFSPLRSEIRYLVAAMILRRGRSIGRVHSRVLTTRKALQRLRVPRGAVRQMFAALLLVLHYEQGPVPPQTLRRVADILKRWKQDHRWLTGADDLPAAALHAMGDEAVETLSRNVEEAYQRLREAGFSRGNQLQLVSHLLGIDPRGVHSAVQRFAQMARDFKARGQSIRPQRYDEVAILTLIPGEPDGVARTVLAHRDRLRTARPRPSKEIAFSLATGITVSEKVRRSQELGTVRDLASLQMVQAILDAQQAAVMAAVVATTAASSASSSC